MTHYISGSELSLKFFLPGPHGMIVSSGISDIINTINSEPPIFFLKKETTKLDEQEHNQSILPSSMPLSGGKQNKKLKVKSKKNYRKTKKMIVFNKKITINSKKNTKRKVKSKKNLI
jgi:hypothetical protein